MIYLDNAATTFPKPPQVYHIWSHAMRQYGANPGRGGYPFAADTSTAVYHSRETCASFFGAQPENTVFTLNCTQALNYAIKGIAGKAPHFVISDIEHNAVLRPIHACAAAKGGSYSIFGTDPDDDITLARAKNAIRSDTVAMVCTAASNVTGRRLPLKQLAQLCRSYGICFIVDAAQGAGTLPLKLGDGINIICAAGHKGLYGPMGTGLLLTDGKYHLRSLIEGGTGSASEKLTQPDFMPDKFESGTINTAGAIALGSGVRFVMDKSTDTILRHELKLCTQFCEQAKSIDRLRLYTDITEQTQQYYVPVVSFNIEGIGSSELSEMLGQRGFCLRGGLHCAPLAHKKLGTLETGTVRFAPSVFTSSAEVTQLLRELRRIAAE